jgi:hypothetical protein
VRVFHITCGNCGYTWTSQSKAEKRLSCSRCKASIYLPRNIRPFPSSNIATTTATSSDSLSPETIAFIDKSWTAAKEESIMFLDQLFNNPKLTRAEKLRKYAEHLREVANLEVSYNAPKNSLSVLLRDAAHYEKLAASSTSNDPNPSYDARNNVIKNIRQSDSSSNRSSNRIRSPLVKKRV